MMRELLTIYLISRKIPLRREQSFKYNNKHQRGGRQIELVFEDDGRA
jgi:hypothetical protein